jgi:cation-transporting ATPase 13A1
MYKILALNSLITAFSLSALYLDGIRYGDTQMTLQGFLLAGCFLFLSWAKPIQRLSKERPQPNIFNWYILLSVLGQFAVHVAALWYVVSEIKWFLPPDWKPDLDSTKFEPNILNSAVYLISLSMQVSTFLINYQGRPFRESLRENRPLYMSLSTLFGIAVFAAAEVMPELNEWVEIVPLPGRFSEKLVSAILLDFGLSWLIEQTAKKLFADHKPLRSLRLNDPEWEELGPASQELAVKPPRFTQ